MKINEDILERHNHTIHQNKRETKEQYSFNEKYSQSFQELPQQMSHLRVKFKIIIINDHFSFNLI